MVKKVLRSSQDRSPSLRYPSTPLQDGMGNEWRHQSSAGTMNFAHFCRSNVWLFHSDHQRRRGSAIGPPEGREMQKKKVAMETDLDKVKALLLSVTKVIAPTIIPNHNHYLSTSCWLLKVAVSAKDGDIGYHLA